MSAAVLHKTAEFRLYPTTAQATVLERWLLAAGRLRNLALDQRRKAYRRRGEPISLNDQCAWLTQLRRRVRWLRDLPVRFARDALRRVERAFRHFFRRLKAGGKAGYPRFRPARRHRSLEYLAAGQYVGARYVRVPGLGKIRARGRFALAAGAEGQKLLRVLRRPSGWYAQLLVVTGMAPPVVEPKTIVGIDVGLESLLTTDAGEKVENPRYLRRAERQLKFTQRRVARRQRGSNNRRKAVRRLARQHERVAAKRRTLAHAVSTDLVRRYDVIGHEKLNVRGLARSRLAKSVQDAAWGLLLGMIAYKAASAGKWDVPVEAAGTSQECPWCGRTQKKSLSEREHRCPCNPGVVLDRDQASGLVIRARAARVVAEQTCGGNDLYAALLRGASRPEETGSPNHWRRSTQC